MGFHRKKIFGYILLLVFVFLVLLASYFFKVSLVDYRSDTYTSNVGELVGNKLAGQTFVASADNLSGISVMFATYSGRDNTNPVKFGLRASVNNKADLRSIEVNPGRLGDNQLYHFSFAPIAQSRGQTYFFYLISPASIPGNAVTVDIDKHDPYLLGSAYITSTTANPLEPNFLAQSGKPQTDLVFATHYQVPLTVWTKTKLAATIRSFIYSWENNQANNVIWAGVALQSFLLLGIALAAYVAFDQSNGQPKNNSIIFIFLGFLFFIALASRLLYAVELPVTSDEGSYLYDASSLLQRNLAGGDGYVKAPLVILWIAFWEFIGGHTVLVGRLSSVFVGALTLFPIYIIGSKLWDRRAGLVAAAAWSLLGVTTVFNIYVHTQPLAMFFGVTGIALTLCGLSASQTDPTRANNKYFWFFLAGLMFGLGVISRKSILALGLVPLCLIFFAGEISWHGKILRLLFIGSGFILIVAFLLLWAHSIYGVEGLQEALGINSAEDGLSAVEASQQEQVRAYSIRGITPFFRESMPLIFLSLLGLGIASATWLQSVAFKFFKSNNRLARFAAKIGWFFPFLIFFRAWQFFFEYEGSKFFLFGMENLWWAIGIMLVIIAVFTPDSLPFSQYNSVSRSFSAWLVPVAWFGGLMYFYFNWIKFHANYLGEFLPPLVLLAGLALPATWDRLLRLSFFKRSFVTQIARVAIYTGLVVVVGWSLLVSNFITYSYEHTGTYTQDAVQEAATWAANNISRRDSIFTGATVVPYVSGHATSANISHPRWYAYEFTRSDPERLNTFLPPVAEMLDAYRAAQWFLLDDQTAFSYLMEYGEIAEGLSRDWQQVHGIANGSNTLTFYRRIDKKQ